MDIGGPELLLVFVVILVLFGGQKIPELARGLGKGIREFKKAQAGIEEEFNKATDTSKGPARPAGSPENKSAS
ncbi:MAG TPA: twin-arginine translocase TatA/TatE family subunit [Chlorobaculum sp.]|nr:twin-arginine translocase TatA/TatE family subunit [Chlorobaculum sp.]